MDNDNNFESFSKSLSGLSQYSDVCEDFYEQKKTSIKNINHNNQKIIKNNIGIKEKVFKKTNTYMDNAFLPIPENTNENSLENLKILYNKKDSSQMIEDEFNVKNQINNLTNKHGLLQNDDQIVNDKTISTAKIEEDLYSINENSQYFSSKKNSDKDFNEFKFDKSDIIIKKKNIGTFDANLKPLDTIKNGNSNNNLFLNLNTKKENKPVNKQFKRYKTITDIKNICNLRGDISPQNTYIISKNSKKSNEKHSYFDIKNILKKAVVMNGAKCNKLKKSLKKSNILLSGEFNDVNDSKLDDKLPINNIEFGDIKIDEININFLKKHLRKIETESKHKNSSNKYIKTLLELQNFYTDNSEVWVIKISPDGRFLAGGCKKGKIIIYEVMGYNFSQYKINYNKNNILEYLNFLNETPYKTLEKHKSDIIDLSWSPFYPNLLLSSSFDHYVYLWDINQEGSNCLINEYEHNDIVTSISFNPNIKNYFISGCLDTFVTVWKFDYYFSAVEDIEENYNKNNNENNKYENSEANIIDKLLKDNKSIINKNKNKKNNKINNTDTNPANDTIEEINKTNQYLEQTYKNRIDYFNIAQKITSLSYFPDGSKIAIGTEKGKIYVYNTFPKIHYNNNFFVSKKKFGIFHDGKKVTNIQFIDKIHAIIATCDSYIRLADMIAGKILYQYKGYVNKDYMTRAYADLNDDIIIAGGDDGHCYIWNLIDKKNNKKNKNHVNFKPFSKELITCSLIAGENCYINYMQKIFKLTNKIIIVSIIINGTSKGRLEVLLNIDEDFQRK